MNTYRIEHDIKVFGVRVMEFPQGIPQAFDALAKQIVDGYKRNYYGISYFDDTGSIIYQAAAEEKEEGEGEKYPYERYRIESGDYLVASIQNWQQKTSSIKDVFHTIMQDNRADHSGKCVEWYKSDDEMWCMIKKLTSA